MKRTLLTIVILAWESDAKQVERWRPVFDEQFHVCDVTTSCADQVFRVQAHDVFRLAFSGVEILEILVRKPDGSSYSIAGNWPESAYKLSELRSMTFLDLNFRTFQCKGLWSDSHYETLFQSDGQFDFEVRFKRGKRQRTIRFRIIQTFFRMPDE